MDLISVVIDSKNSEKICFLCFKDKDIKLTMSIYETLFINDENKAFYSSLYEMIKCLFPFIETFFHRACDDCSHLIIGMYIAMRKYSEKLKNYNLILENLMKQVDLKSSFHCTSNESFKLYVTPTHNDVNQEPMQEKLVKCKKCKMEFDSEKHLREHKKISHDKFNDGNICEKCGKMCRTSAALKTHLNCHKEKTCPYCLKNLKPHSHYNLHVKSHQYKRKKERKKNYYFCYDCNYKTLNKSCLEAHKNKAHLNKRPFTCDICLKGFFKKSNLTEHVLIHKEDKNFTCETCGDNFVSHKTLLIHQRLHSGEKPYECEICKAKFVTQGRRYDHYKRKHMEKSECCLICDKKYSLKKQLNRHMRTSHSQFTDGGSS